MNKKITHIDLAKELCDFSKELCDKKEIFNENKQIYKKTIINRLYYSMYHKILHVLNKNLTGNSIHETLENILERNASNETIDKIYQLFRTLKSLRIWADYKLEEIPSDIDDKKIIYYQKRVYNIIKQNFTLKQI